MKTIIAVVAGIVYSVSSLAQVEQDDMYFNKKDRAKLNKEKATEQTETFARADKSVRFDYPVQTVDNTSRYANPEYVSRSQAEMVSGEDEAAFIENYQYASQDQLNQFNNNLNSWNTNPIYSNTYFSPSINNWNSPYYSPYNDPYMNGFGNNPWNNPYFGSGWSVSFGNYWGNPWNYGWGRPSFGYNICWNGGWGSSWGYGGGYWNNYYGGGYYPTVIVINENSRGPVYGKRSSRSQQVTQTNRSSSSSSPNANRTYSTSRSNSTTNGSTATRGESQTSRSSEYYTPQWRRAPQQPNVSGGNSSNGSSYQNRTSTDVFNNSRSSGSQQRSESHSTPSQRSPSPSSTPSRSSSGSGGGSSRSSRGGN